MRPTRCAPRIRPLSLQRASCNRTASPRAAVYQSQLRIHAQLRACLRASLRKGQRSDRGSVKHAGRHDSPRTLPSRILRTIIAIVVRYCVRAPPAASPQAHTALETLCRYSLSRSRHSPPAQCPHKLSSRDQHSPRSMHNNREKSCVLAAACDANPPSRVRSLYRVAYAHRCHVTNASISHSPALIELAASVRHAEHRTFVPARAACARTPQQYNHRRPYDPLANPQAPYDASL